LNNLGAPLSEFTGVGPNGYLRYPNMTEGTYYVEILDANSGGGSNYWGYLFLIARDYNAYPYPVETESNDSVSTANVVQLTTSQTMGGKYYNSGKYFGELTASVGGTTIDWFSIDHDFSDPTAQITICLNSSLFGSTASTTVTLYNSTNQQLGQAIGNPSTDPTLAIEYQVSTPGDYFFSIDGGSNQLSDWYQITVLSTDFEPTSYNCP